MFGGESARRRIEEIAALIAELLKAILSHFKSSNSGVDDFDLLEREVSNRFRRRKHCAEFLPEFIFDVLEQRRCLKNRKNRPERVGIARRFDAVLGEVDLIRFVGDEGRNRSLILILI